MTAAVQLDDVGWMYNNAGKLKKKTLKVPPISQIPGIGNYPEEENPPKTKAGDVWIKETDSPYQILSKVGGRQDLLTFTNFKPSVEAVPYSKCDWYYLEDNKLEDLAKFKEKKQEADDAAKQEEIKLSSKFLPKEPDQDATAKFGLRKLKRRKPRQIPWGTKEQSMYGFKPPYRVDFCDWWPAKNAYVPGVANPKPYVKPKNLISPFPEDKEIEEIGKIIAHTYGREWYEKRKAWYKEYCKNAAEEKNDRKEKLCGKLLKPLGLTSSKGAQIRPETICDKEICPYRIESKSHYPPKSKYVPGIAGIPEKAPETSENIQKKLKKKVVQPIYGANSSKACEVRKTTTILEAITPPWRRDIIDHWPKTVKLVSIGEYKKMLRKKDETPDLPEISMHDKENMAKTIAHTYGEDWEYARRKYYKDYRAYLEAKRLRKGNKYGLSDKDVALQAYREKLMAERLKAKANYKPPFIPVVHPV